jgi:hypothetical protein
LRNISKLAVVFALPALMLLSPVDAVFGTTMTRKALVQPLLLLLFGWALPRLFRLRGTALHAPAAVAAATLLVLFWMIPRSIDLTQIYFGASALFVASLFTAGFLLSRYFRLLPGVAKTAYALYFSSMIVALGFLYASQSTLLCSAYTLEQQHRFGEMLIPLGIGAYLLVLAFLTKWLIAPGHIARTRVQGVESRP